VRPPAKWRRAGNLELGLQDQREFTQVENHLIGCPACAERAAAMTGSIAALIRTLQRLESEDTGKLH
jgi:anti-sigma factor RsiW